MLKGRERGLARGLGRRDGAQHPLGALAQVGVDSSRVTGRKRDSLAQPE